MMKLVGATLILIGSGAIGFMMAAGYRNQGMALQQLLRALEYMGCDLQYRMTPLPELCSGAAQVCTGCVKNVLHSLSDELDKQAAPDAVAGMKAVVSQYPNLPGKLQECLVLLGDSLGRFDLSGQLQGLTSVKKQAQMELEQLRANQDLRLRNYQTLGLCTGAALVVLFL